VIDSQRLEHFSLPLQGVNLKELKPEGAEFARVGQY